MIDLTEERLKDMRAWARWDGFPSFPLPTDSEEAPGLLFTPGMPVALMCEKVYDVLGDTDQAGFEGILQIAGEIVRQGEQALEQDQAEVRAVGHKVFHPAKLIIGPYRVLMFCLERAPSIDCPRSKLFASLALWALEVHRSFLVANNHKDSEFAFRNAALFLVEALAEKYKEREKELAVVQRSVSGRKAVKARHSQSEPKWDKAKAYYFTLTCRTTREAAQKILDARLVSFARETIEKRIRQWELERKGESAA
jgi:hypothetical protein